MIPEIRKVCGITQLQDAAYAAGRGASALGFIFYSKSPRNVSVDDAVTLAGAVAKDVLRVGVFVNEFPDYIEHVADRVGLDVIQLHGDEEPETAEALKARRVWKAFRMDADFDTSALVRFRPHVEAFLLDTAPRQVDQYGGSGETFAWERAADLARQDKIIVAGGLDGANVARAIRTVGPWGVDSSSRLELRPGVKDPSKVKAYLEAAQSVD